VKLTVEIIGERIIYDYQIGKSTQHGESDICPESLNAFNLMLKMCSNYHTQQYQEWMNEITARAYIERHPELLAESQKDKK
jgi:hypothetical protein